MTDWTDIHKDFNEYEQQKWEKANITKEEAQEWIELGFKPDELHHIRDWKNLNFSPTETKSWLEVGLDEEDWVKKDWEFAFWLRTNNYTPKLVKNNLEQLRNDYENLKVNNSQSWLEQIYTNHNIKELVIGNKNLKGELNLSKYQQLEWLNCSDNKLTNIILPPSLKALSLIDNNFNQDNNNFNRDLSFLVPCINLESLDLRYNNFTGSLDYLSGMEKLKELNISNTDINEVQIDKLPRNLETFYYSADKRPDCKLTAIIPKLKEFSASQKSRSEINQFIQQRNLTKIPYEHLDNIEYLAQGGFGRIYQAEWQDKNVILKSLSNSQEITPELLHEIASHGLFGKENKIIKCYGISQNPKTSEYVMVMDCAKGGNIRKHLKDNISNLDLKKKLIQLHSITEGLKNIHVKGLVHKDFHSGNILSRGTGVYLDDLVCSITDLGLCRPSNETNSENVYGVLPYVAPEVLRGQSYTQASDVYSFGIVAYELLANSYPYPEMDDMNLAFAVCNNHRPNIDKIPIPQLLKDLIKSCWDANPNKRPNAKEMYEIVNGWYEEVKNKKDAEFYQQYQLAEKEYNNFSQSASYKVHYMATLTSKLINTKEIDKQLQTTEYSESLVFNFKTEEGTTLEVQEITKKKSELIEQLEEKKDNLQKLQHEIQQLETQIKELEEQEQQQTQIEQPPK